LWIREGLAEYYGSIESERYAIGEDRTLQIGYPIYSHAKQLRDRSFIPVDKLFSMTDDSPVFVAESWALVHMLLNNGSNDFLKRLLELLLDGKPAAQSFEAVYDAAPARVDVLLKDYIQSSKKSGFRLVGDTDYEPIAQKASFVTPVPGGVGPMTIIMLMYNTVKAACLKHGVPFEI